MLKSVATVLEGIPESGIIELKPLYFKDAKARIEPTKSSRTGRLLGVPVISDDDKKSLTFFTTADTFVYIVAGYKFDLSDFEQRMTWAMVRHSPLVASSFESGQNTPGAMFFVNNEDDEVKKDLDHEDKFYKALQYIHKDTDAELVARVRLLGVDMTGETASSAKKYLLKLARDSGGVTRILGIYESNAVEITIIFYDACDKGIIKRKNGIFVYGTLPLGADEDQVINALQAPNNASLLDQIKKEINPEVFGKAAPKTSDEARSKKQQ